MLLPPCFYEEILNQVFLFQTSDGALSSCQSALPIVLLPAKGQAPSAPAVEVTPAPPKPMAELDLLGKTMLQQALPPESQQVKWWVCLLGFVLRSHSLAQLSVVVDAGTSFSLNPESPYEICRSPTPSQLWLGTLYPPHRPPCPVRLTSQGLLISCCQLLQLLIPTTASL